MAFRRIFRQSFFRRNALRIHPRWRAFPRRRFFSSRRYRRLR